MVCTASCGLKWAPRVIIQCHFRIIHEDTIRFVACRRRRRLIDSARSGASTLSRPKVSLRQSQRRVFAAAWRTFSTGAAFREVRGVPMRLHSLGVRKAELDAQ